MKKYDHIIIPETVKNSIIYSVSAQSHKLKLPKCDRKTHAEYLTRRFEAIKNDKLKQQIKVKSLPSINGTYLEFKGFLGYDLKTQSLENIRAGIRLLNVRYEKAKNEETQIYATVYVPYGKENVFLKKLQDYATKENDKGKPKNDELFRSIQDVSLAFLDSLWTDNKRDFPSENNDWYEVWLRISNPEERNAEHNKFIEILRSLNISFKENSVLEFPERSVFFVYANNESLSNLLLYSEQLAEFRCGRELTSFLLNERTFEQELWVEDLVNRLEVDKTDSVVCVLDSGVNNGHPLLNPIIQDEFCSSVIGHGSADRKMYGHGTQMCGTVIYGDLSYFLANNQKIKINHQVGSIKIVQIDSDNKKEFWGDLTKQAVYSSESIFPNKRICYCMAVTAEDCKNGCPSSWSGAIDSILYNRGSNSNSYGRLFIISAGNINPSDIDIISDYPNSNSLREIQNPAQSWNCLTVGAFTNLVASNNEHLKQYDRVAPSGGISPFSRTSCLWKKSALIKPEVVFEGGNLYKTNDPQIPFDSDPDLELMTTNSDFQVRGYFDTINATSAATALASRFAGKIQSHYPYLWAESVRGLIVHSAQWTKSMEEQFPVKTKTDMARRLRNCGYGYPSEERALYSTENGLTYIAQEIIQPFIKQKKDTAPKMNEMHIFDLPWPKETLEFLAEQEVTMRVTLSYFIEPAPGEIGWQDKYRYASCGLRFDVNQENEDKKAFLSRINKLMQTDEERVKNDSSRWLIGAYNRNKGSIHSDALILSAAQLAACNLIAVFPVGGWWKTRTNLKQYNNKIRYSLIVSLYSSTKNVDLYTSVKSKIDNIIKTPVEVNIPINN